MNAIRWLEQYAPGFSKLRRDERDLFMHFSLLWSLFEGKVLNASASVNALKRVVRRWREGGVLTAETFAIEYAYFKVRYYENGDFTDRFDHLYLERSGNPQVVRNVLSGQDTAPVSVATALLIIVFRFRNNLFHGEKWAYELRG